MHGHGTSVIDRLRDPKVRSTLAEVKTNNADADALPSGKGYLYPHCPLSLSLLLQQSRPTVDALESMADYSIDTLFSPRGKRIVLTGGGSGLGRFIAEGLAAQGANVWIVGRRKEKLQETVDAAQGKVTAYAYSYCVSATTKLNSPCRIVGDINSKEGIQAIVQACPSPFSLMLDPTLILGNMQEYKKSGNTELDVLINCAGILREIKQSPQDGPSS